MCGLLMSIDDSNSGALIKDDKIFQYIVNNGIPFASAKITNNYKTVYVVVDCTGVQQLSGLKNVFRKIGMKDTAMLLYAVR